MRIVSDLDPNVCVAGDVRFSMLNRVSLVDPEEVNVTFDDVKGVDEAKQELQDIVEFLRDPEKFKSLGAKLPKGLFLSLSGL